MNKRPKSQHASLSRHMAAHPFLIIGHRGAAGLIPENTLPGFDHAFSLGCTGLELDVHCIDDANPALCVIHDAKLDRTTNRQGPVRELTRKDLAHIDAGGGEPIPLLEDVLQRWHAYQQKRPVLLNIELKGHDTAERAAEYCQNISGPVLVSSFNYDLLNTFKQHAPHTPVAILYERWRKDWLDQARALGCVAVNLSSRIANKQRIREIRNECFYTFIYTVNTHRRTQQLAGFGASGVFTDRPDKMRSWLANADQSAG